MLNFNQVLECIEKYVKYKNMVAKPILNQCLSFKIPIRVYLVLERKTSINISYKDTWLVHQKSVNKKC